MVAARSLSAHRVVTAASPLSALAQRLAYMDRFPERSFVNVIDNVPQWPSAEGEPSSSWRHVHNYAPAGGVGDLITAIADVEARKHGGRLAEDQLVVTNGALHALSLVLRRHAKPGAVALCQAPVLGSIADMMRSYGYRVAFFATPDGEIDRERIDALLPEAGGVVYVNTPQNPGGCTLSRRATEDLLAIARRRRATLILDMVYDGYAFDGASVASPLAPDPDWRGTYVVSSMSKNYGAPGLRVGWIVSARENVAALTTMLEWENIAVSGLAQDVARAMLARGNAALLEATAEGRRRTIAKLVDGGALPFDVPRGGTQILLRLPVVDVEAFCDFALVELGLGLVSSSHYEGASETFVRLPFGLPAATVEAALTLLGEALARVDREAPSGAVSR